MKVLDLFCGAGGASVGMKMAGVENIIGVDIEMQWEYPTSDLFPQKYEFDFVRSDFMDLDMNWVREFDFIWASPPCQCYSQASARWRRSGRVYPDFAEDVHHFLRVAGRPYAIENVPGAPIRQDILLCGEMFGLHVIRHRIFEISGFECKQPEHKPHRGKVKDGYYVTVAGNGGDYAGHNFCTLNDLPGANQKQTWQFAMGIDWIHDKKALREAVPPAYSEYIFGEFLESRKGDATNYED